MKFRILSDLHLDLNNDAPYKLPNDDIFTLIAGDISSNQNQAIKWIKDNVKRGAFVEGNHILYSDDGATLQDRQNTLRHAFDSGDVYFLENDRVMFPECNIIGATLWTDMRGEHGTDNLEANYTIAGNYMNDYRWAGFTDECSGKDREFRPDDARYMHLQSLEYIRKQVEPEKPCVILTHHAPSFRSCSDKYGRLVDFCYASTLDGFIREHDNIKLWVHGHVHEFQDYMIGGCRVICNPRGYVSYGQQTGFKDELIVDVS